VTDQQRGLGAAFVDETVDVGGQLVGVADRGVALTKFATVT
jgi:hypothetical protein